MHRPAGLVLRVFLCSSRQELLKFSDSQILLPGNIAYGKCKEKADTFIPVSYTHLSGLRVSPTARKIALPKL